MVECFYRPKDFVQEVKRAVGAGRSERIRTVSLDKELKQPEASAESEEEEEAVCWAARLVGPSMGPFFKQNTHQ